MQRVLPNSRQIPKKAQYMAHPGYNDRLYGYLVSISHWDGNKGQPRYLYKDQLNYSSIAKQLDLSRQTVAKKIRYMLENQPLKPGQTTDNFLPLIRYDAKKKMYILLPFEPNLAMLVNQDTLFIMVSLFKDHVISTYVYLYNRFMGTLQKPFPFTYSQIKQAVGIGDKSRGNNNTVVAILFGLQKVGLLKWHQERTASSVNGYIDWMTNEIVDSPVFASEQEQQRYRSLVERNATF